MSLLQLPQTAVWQKLVGCGVALLKIQLIASNWALELVKALCTSWSTSFPGSEISVFVHVSDPSKLLMHDMFIGDYIYSIARHNCLLYAPKRTGLLI